MIANDEGIGTKENVKRKYEEEKLNKNNLNPLIIGVTKKANEGK